jgi:hypothetical protein
VVKNLQDQNVGLMGQVLDAFTQFNIRKLGNVYNTLPVRDICELDIDPRSDPKDVLLDAISMEAYIAAMIANGNLDAKLVKSDQGDTIVSFTPKDPQILALESGGAGIIKHMTEEEVEEQLRIQVDKTAALTRQIQEKDKSLGVNKFYIEHLRKLKKVAGNGQAGVDPIIPDERMLDTAALDEDDEDLMAPVY